MSERNKGILFILMAAFFFALMSLFVKLAGDLPSMEKAFFRNIVALFLRDLFYVRTGFLLRFPRATGFSYF